MKLDQRKMLSEIKPMFQTLLDKFYYEENVEIIAGMNSHMHVLTGGEEVEVENGVSGLDLMTREKRKRILILAHACADVNDVPFENLKEAVDYFSLMNGSVIRLFVQKYNDLVPKSDKQVEEVARQLKNFTIAQNLGGSGEVSKDSQTNTPNGGKV